MAIHTDVGPTRAKLRALVRGPIQSFDSLGDQLAFHLRAIRWIPQTLVHYRHEVLRLIAEVTFGVGVLAVLGGTIGVIVMMSGFTGVVVGLQGYAALDQIGSSVLTGFLSAYVNTREVAPVVAALALSATVGCGFTAQLGAMRISEEIDALEVMGIKSISYLVSTRLVAASGGSFPSSSGAKTRTSAPARVSNRAKAQPSPALLPLPQTMPTFSRGKRALIAWNRARAACSIRSSPG